MEPLSPFGAEPDLVVRQHQPALHWLLVSAVFLAAYLALDRLAIVFAQTPLSVVWYPPAGLGFFLLLVFGPRYVPVLWLAELLTYAFTWKTGLRLFPLLVVSSVPAISYGSAAAILRQAPGFIWTSAGCAT